MKRALFSKELKCLSKSGEENICRQVGGKQALLMREDEASVKQWPRHRQGFRGHYSRKDF